MRCSALNIQDDQFEDIQKWFQYIPKKKQAVILRYKFMEDQKRSLCGELLVRYALGNYLALNGRSIYFERGPYGKPYMVGNPQCQYNISHAGDWVVCAIDEKPVGIDVETIKTIDIRLAKRFFADIEYKQIQHAQDRYKAFFAFWTLKESYIKYMGKGLSLPLNSFQFLCDSDEIIFQGEKSTKIFFDCRMFDENSMLAICAENDCKNQRVDIVDAAELHSYYASLS